MADWESLCAAVNTACVTTVGQRTVTHVPQAGPEQDLATIVNDPVSIGDEMIPGVLSIVSAPFVDFITAPLRNDTIRIGAAEYRVFSSSTDEGGMTFLSLTA